MTCWLPFLAREACSSSWKEKLLKRREDTVEGELESVSRARSVSTLNLLPSLASNLHPATMPIIRSQTLPPKSSPPLASPSPPKPSRIETLSPLRSATVQTSPSSPNKHLPPRPSPLARASTLLQSHLPPHLQNLHFEFEVPQLTLPTLQGFLARSVRPSVEERTLARSTSSSSSLFVSSQIRFSYGRRCRAHRTRDRRRRLRALRTLEVPVWLQLLRRELALSPPVRLVREL